MSEQLQNTILFSQQAIDFRWSILRQVVDFGASDFDFEAVTPGERLL
jgi:hypothetical protein